MKIPFIGQTDEGRSTNVSYQLTQNWYIAATPGGRSQLALYPTPGLTSFGIAGAGPIRAMRVYNSLLYVVSGDTLYEVNTGGGATSRGTLNTSSGNVSMTDNGANNGQQLIIVDGTNGYIWDSGASTFTQISDPQFPNGATHVDFFDGYFVVNDPANSGRFHVSDSYDGTSWTNTFATAERSPDELVSLIVNGRELWLLGDDTTEVWYNAGTTAFPFAPIQSGFSEWGCVAPWSVAKADGAVFWLGKNQQGQGLVLRTDGLRPTIISNEGIANIIGNMTTISDAVGYTYQNYLHTFYVLHFTSESRTLVYDISTGMWHDWSSATIGRHRSNKQAFFNGDNIVGDYQSGNLYKLDNSKYTDNGATITRIRRSPYIHADDKAVFHHAVEILFETGVGDVTTPNPQAQLKWSDDGGHTFSTAYWRDVGGPTGNYDKRTVWRRLGRSHGRIYELTITDPVKAVVIEAYARISAGSREIDN